MKKLTKILLTTTSAVLISSIAPAFAQTAVVEPATLLGPDDMRDPALAPALLANFDATPTTEQTTETVETLRSLPGLDGISGTDDDVVTAETVQKVFVITGEYTSDQVAAALPLGAPDYLGDNAITGAWEIDAGVDYTREAGLDGEFGTIDDVITNENLSNLSGSAVVASDITGMYELELNIEETTDGSTPIDTPAPATFNAGSVSTDGILYQSGTGTATIDPVTGVVTIAYDETTVNTTELDVDGLRTTGNVSAADITASGAVTAASVTADLVTTDDVILAGKSLNLTISELQAEFEAQDGVLAGNLTTETNARIAGDAATLTSAKAYTDTSVATEATARASADTALGGRITAEEAARIAADNTEIAARIAGDAATLTSAKAYTDTSVATEATARASADTALGVRITTEETARIAADTGLGNRITTESNARIAADLAESTARIAADNALGARITNETNERIAADNVLRDMIASSTATAIALGGTAILPDANFTLAGNVGFYQGATALSLNAAGRVADKVYLTAAVGGGTNKRGEVGGRVGVVFGF